MILEAISGGRPAITPTQAVTAYEGSTGSHAGAEAYPPRAMAHMLPPLSERRGSQIGGEPQGGWIVGPSFRVGRTSNMYIRGRGASRTADRTQNDALDIDICGLGLPRHLPQIARSFRRRFLVRGVLLPDDADFILADSDDFAPARCI